ncbi:MAG: hypothetical protein HQK55_15800 [Deltaproteobacteria bacterium]|nr:hypothetical protein [Deltaproteobacteria bacterium]
MSDILGIFVSTDRHWEHLVGLTESAHRKGIPVIIFFTSRGVLLTRHPDFHRLAGRAEMSLCRKSFEAFGLLADPPIPGLTRNSFGNQSRHADLIEKSTKYLAL